MDSFAHLAIAVNINCPGLIKIALEFDLPVSYFLSQGTHGFLKKK